MAATQSGQHRTSTLSWALTLPREKKQSRLRELLLHFSLLQRNPGHFLGASLEKDAVK